MVSSNYIFSEHAVTTSRVWTPGVFFSTPKFERALEFREGLSQIKVHCHPSIGKWRWFLNAKNDLRFFLKSPHLGAISLQTMYKVTYNFYIFQVQFKPIHMNAILVNRLTTSKLKDLRKLRKIMDELKVINKLKKRNLSNSACIIVFNYKIILFYDLNTF